MAAVLLALIASASWGVSDFLGGLKTRTIALPYVLAVSQSAGMLVLAVPLVIRGEPLVLDGRLVPAVAAGFGSVCALGLLYYAMAHGTMAVVAPVAASGAALPVLVGLTLGDALSPAAAVGVLLALGGAMAAAWEPGGAETAGPGPGGAETAGPGPGGAETAGPGPGGADAGRPGAGRQGSGRLVAGAALGFGAAAATGFFFTMMDFASAGDPFWATFVMRSTACVLVGTFLLARRRQLVGSRRPTGRRAWLALIAIGMSDAVAELSFATATTTGQLSIVSVLSSLYPVVTVLLALAVLRERMHPLQAVGAAGVLVGVLLLAQAA